MLSVVAMSSADPPLLSTNFTSEVTSTSSNNSNNDNTTVDISDCRIKSEPDSEDSSSPEDVKNINGNSNDDNASFQKHKENMTLKSEFVKKDITSSEEGNSPPRMKIVDKSSSPPHAPQHPPKKSFMTSRILGDIDSVPSVSPVCQVSPPVVASTSSVACSMVSPNDSNFSSNGASPNSSNRGSVCSPTNSITSITTSPMSSPPTSTFPQTHLLFQPFLPYNQQQPQSPSQQSLLHHSSLKHQHSRTHPNVPQMVQRALPFSIDNILKPTFGRGDDDPSAVTSHLFSPFLGASLASSILQHHHQQQQNLLQQAAAAHAVSAAVSAAANSTLKENSLSNLSSGPIGQFPSSAFNPRGDIVSPSGSSLSSPRSPTYSSSSVPPMGSCKPKNFKIKQEPPPPARSPEKGTLPKEAVVKKSNTNPNQPVDLSKSADESENQDKDEDLPPGMVRGPNGQLWPAWVFCTRYSDRPSSGK